MQNNTTLATILSHRSIRHFTEQPIAEDVFQTFMPRHQIICNV